MDGTLNLVLLLQTSLSNRRMADGALVIGLASGVSDILKVNLPVVVSGGRVLLRALLDDDQCGRHGSGDGVGRITKGELKVMDVSVFAEEYS